MDRVIIEDMLAGFSTANWKWTINETPSELSTAEPERKTGKWINRQKVYSDISIATCSECGTRVAVGKYCSNCGKRMDEND